jgi:hypothetical protein
MSDEHKFDVILADNGHVYDEHGWAKWLERNRYLEDCKKAGAYIFSVMEGIRFCYRKALQRGVYDLVEPLCVFPKNFDAPPFTERFAEYNHQRNVILVKMRKAYLWNSTMRRITSLVH